VTLELNSSFRRGSNATRRAVPSASPAALSISGPAHASYVLGSEIKIGLTLLSAAWPSGECRLISVSPVTCPGHNLGTYPSPLVISERGSWALIAQSPAP
jgi:hypothetical protein